MTLIAAFTTEERPTLIGDLLITNSQTLQPAGICRKLLRINPNLVVGWSGSMLGAKMVCRELRTCLPDNVSPEQLHGALLAQLADLGQMHIGLVGWMYHDSRWQAFEWDSSSPDRMPVDTYGAMGSGAQIFRGLVPQKGLHLGPPGSNATVRDANSPAGHVLTVSGRLMASDLSDRHNQLTSYFGVAYDIWIANGRRFESIGSVTYSAMNVRVNAADEIVHLHEPFGLLTLELPRFRGQVSVLAL